MSMLTMFRNWFKTDSEQVEFKKMWTDKNETFFKNWSHDVTKDYFLNEAYYVMCLEKRIESLENEIQELKDVIFDIQGSIT